MPHGHNRSSVPAAVPALLGTSSAVRRAHHGGDVEQDQGQCGSVGKTREKMMRVLVAFASKRGGTAGLADMISNALTEAGYEAILQPARDVRSLAGVDAVIVAGPLYAYRWHRDARRFVRRNTAALRNL